jgi:DNA repair exonuclease SbcCD ATPase subunit
MALEANIVYLEEELKNNRERLELIKKHLKENPSVSIYRRKINDRIYYYKKYWKDGKSVSEFLCKSETDYHEHMKEIKAANEKRKKIKAQFKKLKQTTTALEKQLKIARKAYEHV